VTGTRFRQAGLNIHLFTAALEPARRADVGAAWNAVSSTPSQMRTWTLLKLAIARDLERLYSSLLAEPVPRDLRDFIDRLTRVSEQRR